MHSLTAGGNMTNQALDRLRKLAIQESEIAGCHPNQAFDGMGLNLLDPAKRFGYDVTPLNASTFAHTGGEGVHFSLVHIEGKLTDDSPVVMTLPAGFERKNVILGSNLVEFLCLGCQIGYFPLEQLIYQYSDTIGWIKDPTLWHTAAGYTSDDPYLLKEQRLLRIIRDEFSLSPWQEAEERLFDLQIEYLPLLKYDSEYLEDLQSLVISMNRNREQ
jgi:hypothetical protein